MLLVCYWILLQKANHNSYSTLLLSCIADYYHMFCTIFCFSKYSRRWVVSSNTIYLQYYRYNVLRHVAQKANIVVAAQPLEACKGIFVVFLTSVTLFFPWREENSSYHSCKSAPIIIHLNIFLVMAYFAILGGVRWYKHTANGEAVPFSESREDLRGKALFSCARWNKGRKNSEICQVWPHRRQN